MLDEKLLGILFCGFVIFLSWLVCFLLTEFKYLWCKHECDKCGCWSCKLFPKHDKSLKWIPVDEKYPEDDSRVLVSFLNSDHLDIARYYEDDEGGVFRVADTYISFIEMGLFVNAWMPFPVEKYCEKPGIQHK